MVNIVDSWVKNRDLNVNLIGDSRLELEITTND